jgi:hypothetical protein
MITVHFGGEKTNKNRVISLAFAKYARKIRLLSHFL